MKKEDKTNTRETRGATLYAGAKRKISGLL